MAERHSGRARQESDAYYTPPYATRLLMPMLNLPVGCEVWEPAAGIGQMVDQISKRGLKVVGTDINPCPSKLIEQYDFMDRETSFEFTRLRDFSAIITNPPYDLAIEFCYLACAIMRERSGVVAMLLKVNAAASERAAGLFDTDRGLTGVYHIKPRIVWFEKSFSEWKAGGCKSEAPSEDHAWFVWDFRSKNRATDTFVKVLIDEDERERRKRLQKQRKSLLQVEKGGWP